MIQKNKPDKYLVRLQVIEKLSRDVYSWEVFSKEELDLLTQTLQKPKTSKYENIFYRTRDCVGGLSVTRETLPEKLMSRVKVFKVNDQELSFFNSLRINQENTLSKIKGYLLEEEKKGVEVKFEDTQFLTPEDDGAEALPQAEPTTGAQWTTTTDVHFEAPTNIEW